MKLIFSTFQLSFLGILGLGAAAPAYANTDPSTLGPPPPIPAPIVMPIELTVVESCQIAATPLHFGNIINVGKRPTSTATISLRCTPNVDYSISIAPSATHIRNVRRLYNASAGHYVRYKIYRNAGHSQVWDHRNSKKLTGNSGTTGIVTHTAYGQVRSALSAKAGAYSDTLIVAVDF